MNDPLQQLRLRFTGLQLRADSPYGQVYSGQDFTGAGVTVALLSPQAAADPAVRQAFANVVWQYSNVPANSPLAVYAADVNAASPWAAVRSTPGQPGAEQLLAAAGGAVGTGAPAAPMAPAPASYPAAPPGYAAAPGGYGAPPGQPPYGAPGAPPGYPAPAKTGGGSPWPWLLGVAGGVVVLVLLAVVAVVVVRSVGSEEDEPPVSQPPTVPQLPTAPPGIPPTPGPGQPEPPGGTAEPELRDLEPVSIIGPTWEDGDDTYTMAFQGWPFAFRTPRPWNCFGGGFDPIPEALAWHCAGEPGSDQRVSVMLWECPTTCTEGEQQDMVAAWLDDPDEAEAHRDLPTFYVEYERNVNDRYAVDLSHFAGDPAEAGGPLRWHIGVFAESPEETRDDVLRILNDIVTQSTG